MAVEGFHLALVGSRIELSLDCTLQLL